MSELIEQLTRLIAEKLRTNLDLEIDQLVSELKSEIENKPQFAALLQTNALMIQINQGNANALQIAVNGGIAYIGTHYRLELGRHLKPKRLKGILSHLIPEILATSTRSFFLDHQPPDTIGFQGRREELTQIRDWLSDNRIRLIGIVSPTGYGKSTLAARIYEEIFISEQKIWINFNRPCSFRNFGYGLLEKLGQQINEIDDHALANALIEHLSNHRFLLVLDNLEPLLNQERKFVDRGYQKFLLQWIERNNSSTILLTSQEQPEALKYHGQECSWYHLQGLTNDAAIQLLHVHHVSGRESDLLRFVSAADGHPLLLKLTANWLHNEPIDNANVSHILSQRELNQYTQLLGVHRENPEASVGNLLAASLERLSPRLRNLWLNLSVYYRSFRLEAAQAVSEESVTSEDLYELARRSLLEEQRSQGQWQYHFLPLVKGFAKQQIQQVDNQTEVRRRAIAYCRSVAMPSGWTAEEVQKVVYYRWLSRSPNWRTQEDVAEYLEVFYYYCELRQYALAFYFLWHTGCDAFLDLRGYNSIRVELHTALEDVWEPDPSQDTERIVFSEMLNCLGTAYCALGQYQLAIDFHNRALEGFRAIEACKREEAISLRNLGKVYVAQERYKDAVNVFEQAREIFSEINATLGEFLSLNDLVDTDNVRGEYQRNIERYQRLIQIHQSNNNSVEEAEYWNQLGVTCRRLGKYQEAIEAFRRARQIFRRMSGNLEHFRSMQVQILVNLGEAYEASSRLLNTSKTSRNYYRSRRACQAAIAANQQAFRISNNRLEQANALRSLGWNLNSLGQHREAIENYRQALEIFQTIGNRLGEANTLNGLGVVCETLNYYSEAEAYYQRALEIYREFDNPGGEAVAQNNLGVIYEQQGQYSEAIEAYQESLDIHCRLGDLESEARTRHNLGRAWTSLGEEHYNQRQYQQAAQCYRQALNAFQNIEGDFRTHETETREATALLRLGNAYHFLERYQDAVGLHQRTLEIRRALGDRPGEAHTLLCLGDAYYALGNYNQPVNKNAFECYQQALTIFQDIHHCIGTAHALSSLGNTYYSLRQYSNAIDSFQEALNIFHEISNHESETHILFVLGNVHLSCNGYSQAVEFYQQALKLRRRIDNQDRGVQTLYHSNAAYIEEAQILHRLGLAYYSLGQAYFGQQQYQNAIEQYDQALIIRYAICNALEEAQTLFSLGNAYHFLAHYSSAIDSYQQSLQVNIRLGNYNQQALIRSNLGNTYNELGRYYFVQKEYLRAVRSYRKALRPIYVNRNRFNVNDNFLQEANIQYNLGNAYKELEQQRTQTRYRRTIQAYKQALRALRAITTPSYVNILRTGILLALSDVYQRSNMLLEELFYSYQAIHIMENHFSVDRRNYALSWKQHFIRFIYRASRFILLNMQRVLSALGRLFSVR